VRWGVSWAHTHITHITPLPFSSSSHILLLSPPLPTSHSSQVDDKAFNDYLAPLMRRRGYSGRYTNKMGKVKEGSCTFWRDSRFREVARHDVLLRDVFRQVRGGRRGGQRVWGRGRGEKEGWDKGGTIKGGSE
jgi:hypothetical protein